MCWGYATARAFGKGWGDSSCDAGTLYLNQINTGYFDLIQPFSYYDVQAGDIVQFGGGSHVAYVASKSANDANGIRVDQVDHAGGQQQVGLTLNQVIQGADVDGGVTARGNPTGYYRKKPVFESRYRNSFGQGQIKVNGTDRNSPVLLTGQYWAAFVSVDAIENGENWFGAVQRFQKWQDATGATKSTDQATSLTSYQTSDTDTTTFTAVFKSEYPITFANS
ncbi:MAG TPA: hypothetical protein VFG50_04460, partial [Rhodothermales bacterium]|nr:hypothetical protein [Rhodothermales bacterium]